MERAKAICRDSDYRESIGFGPTISLKDLKGRSGYFSKKKAAAFLLRCTKQLETPENRENRIYAANIGLQQIIDEDEYASPECLYFELFPGATTADTTQFIKENAQSGEQLCRVLDFSEGEAVLAINYSSDNFRGLL